MKVLVIGESCLDIFHYGESVRLCPDAPVPVFKSIEIISNGGMAKNVEENMTKLGADVEIITNQKWESITKTRFVDQRSNHMFLRVDEKDYSYGELTIEDLEKINFSFYDGVVVSDYNKGLLSEEVLEFISNQHNNTFLDTKKILGEWCNNFSFIKINHKEYELTKNTITNEIRKNLIVTRGANGSEYRNKIYEVENVEIKDTSGAGDTFLSAFVYNYILSKNVGESICFANHCATKVVQKRGVSLV
jgi:bifunctional ADP-heptose synthase (sugar kinase/adenylyltransferase)